MAMVKPWERARSTSGTPSAAGSKPWEQPTGADDPTAGASTSAVASSVRPQARPWEAGAAGGDYASATSTSGIGTSYLGGAYGGGAAPYRPNGLYGGLGTSMYGGGGMYGGSGMYGGGGSMYGGGMYGSGLYGGGGSMYGGGMYGSRAGMYGSGMYGAGGMYGGGMYGSGYGMGGGGGMLGGPMAGGPNGPYDPNLPPPTPPTAWQAILNSINGVMMFFGRLSFLVDENAHAVHFFISALLQLLDRTGSLYAEVARFVLRVLFRRRQPKAAPGGARIPGLTGEPAALALPGPPGPSDAPSAVSRAGGMPGAVAQSLTPHWDDMWGGRGAGAGAERGLP